MNNTGIYKITCVENKKVYIGQSTNIRKRRYDHFAKLRMGAHRNEHLQRSFNKYGEDKFIFEVIEECTFEELDDKEEYYMKMYKSLNKRYGFNIKITEHKKYRHSEETKQKISKIHKGRKVSEETRRKLSIAFKGRVMSPESIRKMSEKRKGQMQGEENNWSKISNKQAEEILKFLMKKESWTVSMGEVANMFNVPYDVVVNLKNNKSYKGILKEYREQIKSDYSNFNVHSNSKIKYNAKPLIADKIINLFKEGYTQSAIAKELKVSRNTIRPILQEAGLLDVSTKIKSS